MSDDQSPTENIILLDDLDLFQEITSCLQATKRQQQPSVTVTALPSGGTGFSESRRFKVNNVDFNFLLISPENAHPFTYLTLGQRALKRRIPLIAAVTQAQTLRRDMYPGDIAIVSEAAALPYPALYRNIDPQEPAKSEPGIETYSATPDVITRYLKHAIKNTLPHIWQKEIQIVRSGYTRHPTLAGGLEPWAPEQLAAVKALGIETLAQTPAGVYEAQHLCIDSAIICFNMIKGHADQSKNQEWNKRQTKLRYPAIRLILDIILNYEDPCVLVSREKSRSKTSEFALD